jgi:hypothetical protein
MTDDDLVRVISVVKEALAGAREPAAEVQR